MTEMAEPTLRRSRRIARIVEIAPFLQRELADAGKSFASITTIHFQHASAMSFNVKIEQQLRIVSVSAASMYPR
jgi:hypothetical protein